MKSLAFLLLLLTILLPSNTFGGELGAVVVSAEAPGRVMVGQLFSVNVTVKYSFSARTRVVVALLNATGGDTVSSQWVELAGEGTRAYSLPIVAPVSPNVMKLRPVALWDSGVWRRGSSLLIEDITVEVGSQPVLTVILGLPWSPVKIDGRLHQTDSRGIVRVEASVDTHQIEAPPSLHPSNGTRWIFQFWGDGHRSNSRALRTQTDALLRAVYARQHYLSVETPFGVARGTGWYDENSTAEFSVWPPLVASRIIPGLAEIYYVFRGWSVDAVGEEFSGTVRMNSPKIVKAVWYADYSGLYMLAGVTLAAGTLSFFLLALVRKRSPGSF